MSERSAEVVFDLLKYLDQRVRVRFQGGREVDGLLKGYDKLDNLVLDECVEYLRGAWANLWPKLTILSLPLDNSIFITHQLTRHLILLQTPMTP